MKPNFELKTMENFVERVSRRKLKSLLHGKAWPQYNYNQHTNSPGGENFYAGSKRKPENSWNTRGYSQILSKPRSSKNFNFNNIRGRHLRGRLYNTATGEVEEESPFILRRRDSSDEDEEFGPLFLDVPARNFEEEEEVRLFIVKLYQFAILFLMFLWLIPEILSA